MQVNEITLKLYYCVKFLELGLTTALTALILSSGLWLIDKIRGQALITEGEVRVIIGVCVTFVFVIFNLYYNHILFNLRLKCAKECRTGGYCIFDCFNITFCSCICRKPCENRLFNLWLLLKWGITTAVFAVVIMMIKKERD